MASITIRNLSDDTKKRLRKQAAENGRSLEAEVRSILDRTALAHRANRPMTGLDIFKPLRDVVDKYGPFELEQLPRAASSDLESENVLHRSGMAEEKQPFRASDKPAPKSGIAESIRRRFAPFGGVELEPFPDEALEALRPPRKTRKK